MSLILRFADYWSSQIWPLTLQIAILVVLISIVGLLLRRAPAQYRYILWLIVLARLCVPIGFSSPMGLGQYPERVVMNIMGWYGLGENRTTNFNLANTIQVGQTDSSIISSSPNLSFSGIPGEKIAPICIVWLAGVFLLGFAIIMRLFRVHQTARAYRPTERPELVALAKHLTQVGGLRKTVTLLQAEEVESPAPAVHGMLRPAIVLPSDMVRTWTLEALEPVLIHELVHIRRLDNIINSVQILLQVLYFFHPMVWFANWAIRRERELACDDEVVRRSHGSSTEYVRSMLLLAETIFRQPHNQFLGIAMAENSSNLGRRIRRMMHADYHRIEKYGFNYTIIILAAGLFCVAVSAQGFPGSSQSNEDNAQPIPPQSLVIGGDKTSPLVNSEPKKTQPSTNDLESKTSTSPFAETKDVSSAKAQASTIISNPVQGTVPIGKQKDSLTLDIAGKWYLTDLASDESVIPDHRVDFVFYKEGNEYRGTVLLRSGVENPLASLQFDGTTVRLQMTARSGRPQDEMPWLVVNFVNNRFEGYYYNSPNTSVGPKLKLVRFEK